MATLLDVPLRPAKPKNQKIPEPQPSGFQVVRRIHQTQQVILRNLPVKCEGQTLKPVLADRGVHLVFFHLCSIVSASQRAADLRFVLQRDAGNHQQQRNREDCLSIPQSYHSQHDQ